MKINLNQLESQKSFEGTEEDYFRKEYQVSSETIEKNIPAGVKQKLIVRLVFILRNIIKSSQNSRLFDFIKETFLFKITYLPLQAWHLWVENQSQLWFFLAGFIILTIVAPLILSQF